MRARASLIFALLHLLAAAASPSRAEIRASASSEQASFPAAKALDADRFSTNSAWRGGAADSWHWQVDFGARTNIGAILHEFTVMESHCGQISFMPKGWKALVGPGPGTLTENQAFRRIDRPIYAAQFHIEMAGAPDSSEKFMRNFLEIARGWGGYR